jgi:hypothetical protein
MSGRLRSSFRLLAAAVLAAGLGARSAAALERAQLLAPDGTLYQVQSGTARDLGVSVYGVGDDDKVLQWSLTRQDGSVAGGMIPGTAGSSVKKNLDLAFEDGTSTLLLLWKEEISVLNVLHLGVLRNGTWKITDLLPNAGFPHAYNPQMLLTHQTVHYLDSDGKDQTRVRPILSLFWWEESHTLQARYAPIFLDEDATASDVEVYDVVTFLGGAVATSDSGLPQGAYQYPALRTDGSNGEIAASFSDLANARHVVVRITFPDSLGTPGATGNKSWERRRVPIFGAKFTAPPFHQSDSGIPSQLPVATLIGPTYIPTLYWKTDAALNYMRLDDKTLAVRAIAINDQMPYERALRLVEEMAGRN